MSYPDTTHTRAIIDNLHTAVIIIGENMQVMCLNPAAEMLFHISNARASKKNLRHLIIEEHEFIDRLDRSLISGHPYTVYDDQLLLHNHEIIDVDYSVSPIQYKSDDPFLLLEFTRLKAHRKITNDENILNQYEASKVLLRGLAHEIKNPLGGIRGSAQLLEKELDAEELKQFTRIIIDETDRLKNLVDRMVGPRDIPTKTNINIHQVLEHVRQLVSAENDGIRFIADYDPSIPDLNADESMLIQVILNITRNAVRETLYDETEDAKIKLTTRTERNRKIGSRTYPLVARIDIEDNGKGVPEELQEKIFMPMITGHADGTGLGLSIAQSLVQQHDGIIEFTSEPGSTIFTILLPISSECRPGNGTSR
jgi:two-component system nitrogen regulation sensor histidine kinase GlnL